MEEIENAVKELLHSNDGHGYDHVKRVEKLALEFARQESVNVEIVQLAALLHDVDDYKLFGKESADHLTNANNILDENGIGGDTKLQVLDIIRNMGYNKYLEGVRPTTLEGKIVSDADMCEAIGAQGILRSHVYNLSKGVTFFDKAVMPNQGEKNSEEYRTVKNEHAVQHFFDKLLLIPTILTTNAGRAEGGKRLRVMLDFLKELFREEDAVEWLRYLERFENEHL